MHRHCYTTLLTNPGANAAAVSGLCVKGENSIYTGRDELDPRPARRALPPTSYMTRGREPFANLLAQAPSTT